MAPRVCVYGMKLPADRCRYVRPSGRRRLQVSDDTLVTDAEYEANLLSQEEVDASESQTEEEFLEDFNEALEESYAEYGLSEAPEAFDADGRIQDGNSNEKSSNNTGVIIGCIAGGLAIAICSFGMYYRARKKP